MLFSLHLIYSGSWTTSSSTPLSERCPGSTLGSMELKSPGSTQDICPELYSQSSNERSAFPTFWLCSLWKMSSIQVSRLSSAPRNLPHDHCRPSSPCILQGIYFCLLLHQRESFKAEWIFKKSFPKNTAPSPLYSNITASVWKNCLLVNGFKHCGLSVVILLHGPKNKLWIINVLFLQNFSCIHLNFCSCCHFQS